MVKTRSKLDEIRGKDRDQLIQKLYSRQNGSCFICGDPINLQLDQVDIDHVTSIVKGLDEEQNWALTHSKENRSKGDRDLQLLQHIYKYRKDRENFLAKSNDFTAGNALDIFYRTRSEVLAQIVDDRIMISYSDKAGKSNTQEFQIIDDSKNAVRSFVGYIPFHFLFHDPDINPRSIVDLEPMIEEFYTDNPQLQPSLGILQFSEPQGNGRIMLFDGQHKAAAQLYLRNDKLLTRVFINPDKNKIKQTNFRAHTIVAQIHFPEFITDKVGHDLFKLKFDSFCDLADNDADSEERFIQITDVSENLRQHLHSFLKYEALFGTGEKHEILNYVETINVRTKKFPLSYDTLDKTFLKFFLNLKASKEALVTSQRYRNLEKKNLGRLMTIFVDEILEGKFDLSKDIFKIEERLSNDPNSIDGGHLSAFRICRKAPMIVWVEQLQKAIIRMLKTKAKYDKADWAEERVLWAEIDEQDWKMVRKMFQVVQQHQIWIERFNKPAMQALSSTRQKDWKEILLDGKLPGRQDRLYSPLTDTKIYDNALNA